LTGGTMRLACTLVLVTGCGLSSGDEPSADLYTRDCIRTMDRGPTLPNGPTALVLTSACSDASMVDNVQWYEGKLASLTSHTAYGAKYRATRIANLDGQYSVETIGIVDSAPSYVAWFGVTMAHPMRVNYMQDFDDLTVADLDRDTKSEIIVAGGDALRVSSVPSTEPAPVIAPADERILVSGKAFKTVAASAKNELFYLAQPLGSQTVEIGVARASGTDPYAFTATALSQDSAGARGLTIADVDGDGLADAIGTAARIFVVGSRTGTVHFLDEAALAISTGDTDADGIDEPVFLAADGASVRRIRIAADGSLTSEHLLDVHAQAMTVGDFDGNGIADVATLDKIGRTGATVSLYRY
jgi:hypothetical protein